MSFLRRKKADKAPVEATNKLRFTGTCSREDFDQACAAHDWWYHSFYFDNGYQKRGDYDIGRHIAAYRFPEDLSGLRILDIGTAAGWFAFYFEQQGASVTAFDTRGMADFDIYGSHEIRNLKDEKPEPDALDEEGDPVYLGPVSRGFWIMRELLQSKIRLLGGSVYEIGATKLVGESFDLVFLGAMLLHVRDPIGALMAARRVCRGRVYATTTVVPDDSGSNVPWMMLPATDKPENAWWRPNMECYRRWFLAAGFRSVTIEGQVDLGIDKGDPTHHNVDQTLQLAVAEV